jgi:hypothetical protein
MNAAAMNRVSANARSGKQYSWQIRESAIPRQKEKAMETRGLCD